MRNRHASLTRTRARTHGCAHARARADFPDVAPPDVPEGATYSWTLIGDAFFAIVPLDSRSRTKQDVRCTTAVLIVRRLYWLLRAAPEHEDATHHVVGRRACQAEDACTEAGGDGLAALRTLAQVPTVATVSCCAAPQWHAIGCGPPQCSLGRCKAQRGAHAPAPRTCLRAAEPRSVPAASKALGSRSLRFAFRRFARSS
jgi:hypothetical protein